MNGTGPVRYLFRMDPESKYLQLREKMSELCGTPANQIAFMDVGGGIVRVGGSVLQHPNPLVLLFRNNTSNYKINVKLITTNTIGCIEMNSTKGI